MRIIKENHQECSINDYIKYLYQEGIRKGLHTNSNFYSEIIKFINSPEGKEGFDKFISTNKEKLGIQHKEDIRSLGHPALGRTYRK